MATFVFGINQTLDGYVDHTAFAPGPTLFRHFTDVTQAQSGCLYGRRKYEVMRYWDDDSAPHGQPGHTQLQQSPYGHKRRYGAVTRAAQ